MITLKKIDDDNIWRVIELTVNDDQKSFVATNTESILEAYVALSEGRVALPFVICDNDTMIGFVMFGFGSVVEEDEPKICEGNYCIWRFMIDKKYQGKGYGKAGLKASLDFLKTNPCGPAKYCWLSFEPENVVAKALYNSMGFIENGEMCEDEIIAVKEL